MTGKYKSSNSKQWKMPKWMEQYRKLIESGCGGLTAEQLMNRHDVNSFNNPLVYELQGLCEEKILLLEKLHDKGLLKENLPERISE